MKLSIFILVISLFTGKAFSQNVFSDFNAHQFGDSVHIQWTLNAGNTCFDMQVERSVDGGLFAEIFTVPGLCGATEDLHYEFFDAEASAGPLFYRITGSSGFYVSDTVKVNFIALENQDFIIFPNPASDVIQIGISAFLEQPFYVELYDVQSKVLYSYTGNSYLQSINVQNIFSGFYFVKITDSKGYSSFRKVMVR